MKRVNSQLISAIISEYIKEEGLEEGLLKVRVFETWNLVVGENVTRCTSNRFFSKGVLYCTINSSILRQQLYFRKDDIIFQMNKMLNSQVIKNIVLK